MTTGLITHTDCLDHVSPSGHPECVERLSVILAALDKLDVKRFDANLATYEQIKLVHDDAHVAVVTENLPIDDNFMIDGDTYLSSGSENAALRGAGAVCQAVDLVMKGEVKNAFCAVRPPGHHAEPDQAMGFCLFNSAAIGALYARKKHFSHRIAIIDFD
ncbi:MAG: histone deacetylase family protein, partial [Emcibacteraceae bacterium]|nr:histone deacetylase family protein [Emcibacteraceae bacterium]